MARTRVGPPELVDPQSLYIQLGHVLASFPGEFPHPPPRETMAWLGRAHALVSATGDVADAKDFKRLMNGLATTLSAFDDDPTTGLLMLLHRALATAELRAPAAVQGAFIPAGNSFDAMAAIGKVLQTSRQEALIVDPYMDEKALTDFASLAPAAVAIRLLADQASHKSTLKPAAARWQFQFGMDRPLEVRLAPARNLHDRLIVIDRTTAWTLTQSLNAFAVRSPASVVRVDDETAALKIAAYETIWQAAMPI